ncbi:STAS domain-containing protein [Labrys monachus]|uniref:Anti-sigma factor antagonist n=1 Tax=Labrys monachus TaxID=217067 RepID=A0ABU0FBG5_9HYPH|nr:STAS domain-containing protein [Labrys monachus]MDQ0391954.1 anti-sigma B factor antagonist [Labrys monachus]
MNIVSSIDENTTHLQVTGRIDASTSPAIDTAVDAAFGEGRHRLVFDLREVNYVSSAGLRAFVRAAKKAKSLGGGIAIFGLQAGVAEIFSVAGFDKIIPIAASDAEAREKLGA